MRDMGGNDSKFRGRVSCGLTVVELLVTVWIIAILMGILLPSLARGRDAARSVVCASTQRQLSQALLAYTTDELDWIPGYGTSGQSLWYRPSAAAIARLDTRARAPVQVNDWMSPSLRDESLPLARNERFYTLLERFSDPAMAERVPIWIGGGDGGNAALASWIRERNLPPAHGISYLMPAMFQLFGASFDRVRFVTQESSAKLKETRKTHAIPPSYAPRLTAVGAPSRKIAFADGFRYLDARRLDFDASYSHQNWGSFSERSPCDIESRSWGRLGAGGTSWNVPLVYRHSGAMNAAFFDGHVAALDKFESRHPGMWAPSGSVLQAQAAREPDVASHGYDPLDAARNVIE